jgi:acyl-CoA thioesterase I
LRLLMRLMALLAVAWLSAVGAAAAAAVHIVAFGDSATAGYLVPRAKAYPAQLEAALRKKGYAAFVENAGINGDTTRDALRRFDSAIGPGTDIAIVEFGVNELRRGSSLTDIRARMNTIVRTLRARHIQILVIGLGSLDLSAVAATNDALYAQWTLPRGKYRASDGQHFNAEGYAIVVARMLPAVETLIARVSVK